MSAAIENVPPKPPMVQAPSSPFDKEFRGKSTVYVTERIVEMVQSGRLEGDDLLICVDSAIRARDGWLEMQLHKEGITAIRRRMANQRRELKRLNKKLRLVALEQKARENIQVNTAATQEILDGPG